MTCLFRRRGVKGLIESKLVYVQVFISIERKFFGLENAKVILLFPLRSALSSLSSSALGEKERKKKIVPRESLLRLVARDRTLERDSSIDPAPRLRAADQDASHGALVSTLGPEAGAAADPAGTPGLRHPESRWFAPASALARNLRTGTT